MSKLIVEMEIPTVCDECPMMYDGIVCAATGTEVYPNNQARILKNGREFDPCENRLDDCPICGVLPDEHGDLVDYDEVEKEFNRLLTYMEEVPDENGIVWFRRETIMPRGYTMKFHTIIPAERKDDE